MAFGAAGCARAVAPIALLCLLLAGCASHPQVYTGYGGPGLGTYRVGSPYEINGVWYYPAVDYNYNRTGIASWYGEQFEGRLTANGEIFDLNQLTAAHTTLPMPSIVRVTNLENGRALQLRVNDRGPFVDGRLIDVSRRAAQLLGFEAQGTTFVQVKILKDESIAAAEEAMRNSGQILVADAAATATVTPPTAPAPIETRPPPRVRMARAPTKTPPPQPRPASPPAIAYAVPSHVEAASMLPPPAAPPPSRTASPLSRFALIAPAEAAELPPVPSREAHMPGGRSAVQEKPPSPSRIAPELNRSSGRIYVQAGAFSVRDNAQRVQSRIARLGSAQVTTTSINGVAMYRVRLGPFQSAAQADQLLARVVDSGYVEARLVGN
jgi:rare lipoprotein A